MCSVFFLDAAITVRLAHVECTGPQFLELHSLYQDIYEACEDWFDRLAERSMALKKALPTFRYTQQPPKSANRIVDVCDTLTILVSVVEKERNSDTVTNAMLDEAIGDLEKYIWKLKSLC